MTSQDNRQQNKALINLAICTALILFVSVAVLPARHVAATVLHTQQSAAATTLNAAVYHNYQLATVDGVVQKTVDAGRTQVPTNGEYSFAPLLRNLFNDVFYEHTKVVVQYRKTDSTGAASNTSKPGSGMPGSVTLKPSDCFSFAEKYEYTITLYYKASKNTSKSVPTPELEPTPAPAPAPASTSRPAPEQATLPNPPTANLTTKPEAASDLEPTKAAEEAQQNTNSNPNTQTSDKGLRGSWSLLSLIISAIAVALVFALLAAILIRREQGKDNEDIQNANKQKAEDASRETSRAISLALLQPADKKPNKKPAQPPIASSEQLIGFDPEGDDDARDRARKSSKTIKTAALALGILTPITFLLLDDLTHPMMWINPWTPIVATVFILHLIALIAYICHHRNQPGRPLVQQSPKCHPEHINTDRALL